MKFSIRTTALLLTLIMILTSLAACTNANNDQNSDPSQESSDNSESTAAPDLSKLPENVFPLFVNGVYTVKIVTANNPKSIDRTIATKLRGALKAITKVTIDASTDYLKDGESYDPNAYEILIGETAHEESVEVHKNIPYDTYGIKLIGRKIIFYFSDTTEGNVLVDLFSNAVKGNGNNTFWVSNTLSVAKCDTVELQNVPKYEGGTQTEVETVDDTKMVVVANTDLAAFQKYCSTVTSSGYTLYSNRDNIDGNYFYTFTKGNSALTVYYTDGRKETRIISGPIKDIPSKEIDDTPEDPEKYKPTLTMIGPSESIENGLALIYQLPNGKFLIIDGGYFLSDRVYKELRELQPDATKFTIAGWFVSHPHGDHQETLEKFIKLHANEVDIEAIYFNYHTPSYYDNLSSPDKQSESDKEGKAVIRLQNLIDQYLSRTTKIIKPHSGQIYTFGKSASVEIITTTDDFLPTKLDNVNSASLIIRVTVAGTSTMVLADATSTLNEIILKMYNSHLKSDMVTLAHHGIWVDTPEIYTRIAAKVLLWPANTSRAQEFYHGNRKPSYTTYSKETIREALKHATDAFLARGTDTVLPLPYTPIGNKQDFITNILQDPS